MFERNLAKREKGIQKGKRGKLRKIKKNEKIKGKKKCQPLTLKPTYLVVKNDFLPIGDIFL